MNAEQVCPSCGEEFSAHAVDGLCLKCLGRLGFSAMKEESPAAEILRAGDYELFEEIARGGMGVVYRARQLSLNRIVAVKLLLQGPFSSPDAIRRFRKEAETAASLHHPNIVDIYEVGESNGNHFLAMEYIEGHNFAALAREQPLDARRAAHYLMLIAHAVHHAHGRGVLHRDLKPSNILLDPFDQPRVTDFGLAKVLHQDPELTLPGQVLGSPNYIPPEQAAGRFSELAPHSDVYSLGAILYQLLTGRPPLQGGTLHEILQQVQQADPVPPRRLNPSVPLDLQTICLKCLQKEPARRYPSAQALAQDLELFLAGRPILARPVGPMSSLWLWCKRHPAMAALSAALVLAVSVGFGGILLEWQRATLHARGETRQRLAAEQQAAVTRLSLYAADVALAAQVMHEGDFGRARRTLDGLRPKSGETDLRGFEWRYLWNLCRGDQVATLTGHDSIVTCVAFAPDGKRAASGGMDGKVRIWDLTDLTCTKILESGAAAVWSVTFTPDNRALMVAGLAGVQFWDAESWKPGKRFPGRLAALAENGTLLATADSNPFFWEEAGTVRLWDPATGLLLWTIEEPGRVVALSPDGACLAVAGTVNGIHLYRTASRKLWRTLPTEKSVWSLRFSPDGSQLLSAGWSGQASLWRVDDDSPPRVFSANRLNLWQAIFLTDGKTIVTTGSDQTIRIWDATTLEQKSVLRGHDSEVWCAAVRFDGEQVITGSKDSRVMLWRASMPEKLKSLPHESDRLPLFSPKSSRLLTINPAKNSGALLWDSSNQTLLARGPAMDHPIVGFSDDGNLLAALAPGQASLEFWEVQASHPARTVALQGLPNQSNEFVTWGLSPDQDTFFGIDKHGTIRVWAARTGNLTAEMRGPAPPIRHAILGPRGRHLALTLERDNSVFLYLCATGNERRLTGHRDFVSGLAFSPDGEKLATGSMDGSIRLWTTADGAAAGLLPGHVEETTDVAFSPDGRTLASIGQRQSLKLWHLPTMREVFSEDMPHAGHYLRFSPDGRRLAVVTDNARLLLLDAP